MKLYLALCVIFLSDKNQGYGRNTEDDAHKVILNFEC